jgi:hypothetical protein
MKPRLVILGADAVIHLKEIGESCSIIKNLSGSRFVTNLLIF